MDFRLDQAVEILRQTPYSLERMLGTLSDEWTRTAGDRDNWAPYDVIGHLIHCEETDWIPRAKVILESGGEFEPFDRWAQFDRPGRRELSDLLTEFAHLRSASLETLMGWQLSEADLGKRGRHPDLGEVTLRQLLSTWVVHDLGHIRQIVSFMARKYDANVGPWKEYLSILK